MYEYQHRELGRDKYEGLYCTIQDLTCRNFGPRERKKRTLKPSVVQYATPADKYSAYLTVSDRLLL